MGYRSDVKALFYTIDVEQWPALQLFVDENFPKDFKDDLEVIGSSIYSGYVFSLENLKWYDSDPDIQAFNKFVEQYIELIEDELPWAYEFVRVGEDYEDIETEREGNCDYLLAVKRSIECEF